MQREELEENLKNEFSIVHLSEQGMALQNQKQLQ